MINFDVQAFFKRLQAIPRLQNSQWELNQSGVDRGMEAILIQRCTREIATYALARLRLACMPDLRGDGQDQPDLDELIRWAKTQRGGCNTMMKAIKMEGDHRTPRAIAAAASLRYYRNRADENPVVKSPWTEKGLAAAETVPHEAFLGYPTSGSMWARKYQTVTTLVRHIRQTPMAKMTDDQVYQSLLSLSGVGPQSASMISLFWLDRPEPIIDDYLKRVLTAWSMVPTGSAMKDREALRSHLKSGAVQVSHALPGWTPQRVLACIYLWCCEVGRFGLAGVDKGQERAR